MYKAVKNFPLPLKIDCQFLGDSLIAELKYLLSSHFARVEQLTDTLWAIKPRDAWHYGRAWRILDRYGVKVI